MTFGEQITTLRKRKNISEVDLGKAVGTSEDIFDKYERNEIKPSVEMAAKIANALEVSLDYLVGKTTVEIDSKSLKRLQYIQQLNDADKMTLFELIVAFLRDRKAKKAYGS